MAGTISLSLSQRYDKTSHEPLDGGILYTYAAGTTTPQSAYQDVDLTIPWPNPITLDSGGNVPQLFFADGYIKFRLTNSAGVTQIEADYVLVVGPSSGGGGAPSVDATTIFQTADFKARYDTGVLDGWVRANGRSIGSATSGATERANADCQELFEHLWSANSNLVVLPTGRGASANADWVANKNIALPDLRGRVIAGLDTMGGTAAGVLTVFGANALGSAGGDDTVTLSLAQLPTGITSVNASQAISVTSSVSDVVRSPSLATTNTSAGAVGKILHNSADVGAITSTGNNSISVTSNNTSGSDHLNVQPTLCVTYYIKL